ncbi:excision repair cross-complementing rodent repair deficiency, complementation group 4 [Planoprotostelium fungivorum]|uniref:Excision repair cross-complementing rodent repair deficiency, complementation group 4 n=1 Tax=Planoprotostelium fungivorum TaxID=1890364 RepID=A0A2P6NDJ4_9EUKA|nr:excision repair cross-complementing rodent repair deficiency, complementation group 4 [Planoprotostelium fungivorum]
MSLAFHREIVSELLDEDGLTVISRGLGLHKIILSLIRLYADSKEVVFVLGVPDEEQELFVEELIEEGVPAQNLPKTSMTGEAVQDRYKLYVAGGVMFATPTSLIMDLLYKRIHPQQIKGFIITNAHRRHIRLLMTDTSTESFIVRLFREGNKRGFIKGFSENPEGFTSTFNHVQKVMKYLFVRKLWLWPRFRDRVDENLKSHTPDVIELHQPLTPTMVKIQDAILEIIDACLKQLKLSPHLDIETMTLEECLFREFDVITRQQLDPVWHKVHKQTKSLIEDMKNLRRLLDQLLYYDCITFYRHLELLRLRDTSEHTPWLSMSATDTLFRMTKQRVFIPKRVAKEDHNEKSKKKIKTPTKKDGGPIIDLETIDPNLVEILGEDSRTSVAESEYSMENSAENSLENSMENSLDSSKGSIDVETSEKVSIDAMAVVVVDETKQEKTIPEGKQEEGSQTVDSTENSQKISGRDEADSDFIPVLEENPKWVLLSEVLGEIRQEQSTTDDRSPVIIKIRDERTSHQLQEFLRMGSKSMLEALLHSYLVSKKEREEEMKARQELEASIMSNYNASASNHTMKVAQRIAAATHKKNSKKNVKKPPRKRASVSPNYGNLLKMFDSSQHVKSVHRKTKPVKKTVIEIHDEGEPEEKKIEDEDLDLRPEPPKKMEYSKEKEHIFYVSGNKKILEEVRPRYVIMYDGDISFYRKLEVFKAENPGVPLRIYWLWYDESIEERKYMTTIDKEQKSFERLIAEKANMIVPIEQDGKTEITLPQDLLPQSNRKGGKIANVPTNKGKKILVDSREFRSALPSILHSKGFDILPHSLDVGDYILTPDVCVERKSIPDLYQSFASGRLFNQATQMCRHFKRPALLIEFHQDKPFNMQEEIPERINSSAIHSKLVLLTYHFPLLRILWSRSPYSTVEMFEDLKNGMEDPDSSHIGVIHTADELIDSHEDVLRTLPGINSTNVGEVMAKVHNLAELSTLSLDKMVKLLGKKNGEALHHFMNHKGRVEFENAVE